jgi:hypothetical protein
LQQGVGQPTVDDGREQDCYTREPDAMFAALQSNITNLRNEMVARFTQPTRKANCSIVVHPYSAVDVPVACTTQVGYVTLNSQRVWAGGWCSSYRNLRGISTMIINPFTCTPHDMRRFDTWESTNDANKFVDYFQYIRDGAVMVGVTGDEPRRALDPALQTLEVAGVDVRDVQIRGNFAFVLQKGYTENTVMRKALNCTEEPAHISVLITGSATDDLIITSV